MRLMRDSLDFTQMPKVAFWGTLQKAIAPIGKRMGFSGGSAIGRLLGSSPKNPVLRQMRPYGDKAEKWIGQTAGKFLSPERTQSLTQAIKGVSRPMMRDAWSNTVFGGVLGGGINAAMAEEGQRGQAFMHGAAAGAGLGAFSGAVQGASTGVVRNLRNKHTYNLAKAHNVPVGSLRSKINKQNMFWNTKDPTAAGFGQDNALKGAFGKHDTLHRQASRAKLVGGMASGLGAGFVLPTLAESAVPSSVLDTVPPPPPPPAPTPPPLLPNVPAVYYNKQGSVVLTRPDFIQLLGRA